MTTNKPKRRALIFGGAGFVGSNLADTLLSSGEAQVHIYDNLSRVGALENLEWLKQSHGGRLLKLSVKDVRDAGAVAWHQALRARRVLPPWVGRLRAGRAADERWTRRRPGGAARHRSAIDGQRGL